ncbi:MAG: transposase [Kiritimatiellae bacterium]|nr:transposase [Kiritimatiellia bacterium]
MAFDAYDGVMNNQTLSQHYQQILGVTEPWRVGEVSLDASGLSIEIRMELNSDTIWACPTCHGRAHIKEWEERRWRHMGNCQFKIFLSARVPKVRCDEHGTRTVQVPWAEGSSRFTMLFEAFAIEVLRACTAKRASELLEISWDEAALNGFWEWLGVEACAHIKAISIDMGKPYQNSARRYFPQAALIFDPFHLMKMLNGAVDQVRREEVVLGTKSAQSSLKKTRQLWLWGEENLPARHSARFDVLTASTLKTARAWRLKEMWRTMKQCVDVHDALAFFKKCYALCMSSKINPVKKVARCFKAHLAGIVPFFMHGFCNAVAEGVNSRLQLLIQKACGYRNRERLKTDILFHFGGRDLSPLSAQ